mgnify:FL=1
MSLELSGTTGVKGVAGSVSAPSIVGDDTNTGISFPSADTIKFSTGGVERMQITNSGVTGTGISAGKILQVVHTVFTGTFSRATSNYDYGAIVTSNAITPSATDSKILIFAVMHMATGNSSGRFGYRVRRVVGGSAAHITPTQFGDGSDNRNVAAAAGRQDSSDQFTPMIFNGIDSPSTTSAVTYQIWSSGEQNDTIYVNRSRNNTDSATHYRPVSSIMLMELKA